MGVIGMRELYIFAIYAAAILSLAAIFTFVDRRFPKIRMPGLYQEKLWLNMLVNVIFVSIIFFVGQTFIY
jgi:hypothetical protein